MTLMFCDLGGDQPLGVLGGTTVACSGWARGRLVMWWTGRIRIIGDGNCVLLEMCFVCEHVLYVFMLLAYNTDMDIVFVYSVVIISL